MQRLTGSRAHLHRRSYSDHVARRWYVANYLFMTIVIMKCDPAVIIHLDTSVSTDNSPAARLVTPSRMTFDSFLESGGKLDSKHNPRDLDDARTLSLADIRDWRGTSETVTEDELDRLVVERRSKLWRIVLASSEHLNTPPFTVPVDPRPHMTLRRADRRTEMWGSIRPSETVYPDLPRLMPDMPPEREHIYRPFMIPIGPRSRASHYVLRPRSSSHHSLPLQQIHISPYAIPPELADIPCKTMTASQLLSEINDIFLAQPSLCPESKNASTNMCLVI